MIAPRQPLCCELPLVDGGCLLDRLNLGIKKELHAAVDWIGDGRDNRPRVINAVVRYPECIAPSDDVVSLEPFGGQERLDRVVNDGRGVRGRGVEKRSDTEPRTTQYAGL